MITVANQLKPVVMVGVGLKTVVVTTGQNVAQPPAAEMNVAHRMKSVVMMNAMILRSVVTI